MLDVEEQLAQYGEATEQYVMARAVEEPSTDRRRRARRAGWAAAAVVLVGVAIGVTLVVRADDSAPQSVSTASPQDRVSPADGWKVIEDREAGLRVSVPESWTRLDAVDTAAPGMPPEVLIVGTEPLERSGVLVACPDDAAGLPKTDVLDRPGTWVSLYEYAEPVFGPPGGGVIERPADFGAVGGIVGEECRAADGTRAFRGFVFTDAGRLFTARIVAMGSDDAGAQAALDLGYRVLDTLGVSPRSGDVVTRTAPTASTTTPTPTATVPAADADADDAGQQTLGDSEQAARDVFVAWLNATDRDAMMNIIEDYASIGDAHREGIAQHSPTTLALYSGRVDSVRAVDDTHVAVTYTVLHDGRPQYANQPGMAVYVDGKWMVSRETVCALLAFGGIACPPRS